MLHELRVSDLGVIDEIALVIEPGMTAFTGETGAGKTLLVEAIDLLVGGRAEGVLVREGAQEATVEGRFVLDGDEVVLRRVVPRSGRSRAYINGGLARVSDLGVVGAGLVDLHGQHGHQSLLHREAQRQALDRYAAIDLGPLRDARAELATIADRLDGLGGDERERAREMDLLGYQHDEIAEVGPVAGEDADLEVEAEMLGDAEGHREAAAAALETLGGDGGALDLLAAALDSLGDRRPFATIAERLRTLHAEAEDAARDLRATAETVELDPERLDVVRQRLRLLADLRRKYGETIADVLDHAAAVDARIAELEAHDERASVLARQRSEVQARIAQLEAEIGAARRAAAPDLAAAIGERLGSLALGGATIEVTVGDDPGDDVEFLVAANPGSPPLPLRKVASGGELARIMLAIRLELTAGPPTLVFDEVDAGIGGEAAVAVGQALHALTASHQVLVVTHLAQVAAGADSQVAVRKHTTTTATTTTVEPLVDHRDRVIELSRMLSGTPGSEQAREHAAELLSTLRRAR